MGLADQLAYMSAAEMALLIRQRDFSPVEVVDAFIARIETRNPSLNAFVINEFDDAARKPGHVRTKSSRRVRVRTGAKYIIGDTANWRASFTACIGTFGKAARVPDNVWSSRARHGGGTETREAGAPIDDIADHLQKSDVEGTRRNYMATSRRRGGWPASEWRPGRRAWAAFEIAYIPEQFQRGGGDCKSAVL